MPLVILTANSIERSSKTMAANPPTILGWLWKSRLCAIPAQATPSHHEYLFPPSLPNGHAKMPSFFPRSGHAKMYMALRLSLGLENLPRDFNSRPSITYQLPCQDAMCFPTLMICKLGFGTRPTASRICPNIPSRGTRGGSNSVRTDHMGHSSWFFDVGYAYCTDGWMEIPYSSYSPVCVSDPAKTLLSHNLCYYDYTNGVLDLRGTWFTTLPLIGSFDA
ncbi:hypothetical protein DFS34DRAFT_590981 [Phlyctochytrium arcticum]|nr:hypothetical protein DFS34DRAFT_590981 [Phlyctochytrium arcticum]